MINVNRSLFGIIIVVGIVFCVFVIINRPISKAAVSEEINTRLTKIVEKDKTLSSALLTIYSNKTGYFEQFAVGTKNQYSELPVQIDSRYHSASIGKTMCATVFGILSDEGKINLNDKISSWLDDDILKGLFVVDGTDYSDQVTLKHLLSHTSGIGDYFEGPVKSGKPMLEIISSNPDLLFTPEELIAFTRENQIPVGKPGQQFYYSDTGYILLGFILEAIEEKPYSAILEDRIFQPLGMTESYFMFYNDKPTDIIGIYMNEIDFSNKNALSIDWAGGGVVTTMNDLLTFMMALENGTILSDDVYSQMTDFSNIYTKGIYYGMGMMYFDFSELSLLLKLSSMTDLYGGVGVTGTYMLYDKEKDTYFIANFGSLDYGEKGLEELVKIRMIYDRMNID
ncbi:serine hydrolase domain-containing protein [Lysinibacillus capsici]|uniref:serine hydrolase domain-containing protein n=1 Tax=Lysinibacillus capsici TaxID=2115968 RepID=UPI0027AA7953|nr:serine hydrolase domain-containing protein [Lysinibacillus capsici]WHP42707.1 serine hydrolase domain-containing protein [Lysinibacillus boronitolerans]